MTRPRMALRIELRGIVQGVGFRPAVFRLAVENAVLGWVLNDGQGLTIHAEAEADRLEAFVAALRTESPPASRIVEFESVPVPVEDFGAFEIRASRSAETPIVLISPDLPVCVACVQELEDPADRRHGYPYINCTACGPRYSIVKSLPYDRANTTLADWPLCSACQTEYVDPRNRRHHAQPTACPCCGPGYRLVRGGETVGTGIDAIIQAVAMLDGGMILAVKGVGGYHLACSALDAAAVRRLRERKFRKEKPFAVMARDLESAARLVRLGALHRSLLVEPARPIVLAPRLVELPGVADGANELGVMIPYAPLHMMLFGHGAPDPLVMTSANRSSEPIAYRDDDALDRLDGLADAFLVGERPIARRVDDSVVAVRGGRRTVLRRSRGLAPAAVTRLPSARPILALGADLKNALTLVVSGHAIASPHIGDLGDLETDRAFEATIHDFIAMYGIDPRDLVVAHDAHPEFVSTRIAGRLACHRRIAVQHHRAHIASVLAESGELDRPVVGLALDGSGYGDDGAIWGFEVFTGSVVAGFRRVAHMRPAQLPGGDAAVRSPVQAAAGFLADLDVPDLSRPPFGFPETFVRARTLVDRNVRCFTTTSAGRLFDTVAALCGFTRDVTYEGQAAIWLEQLARDSSPCPAYPFPGLDYRPLLAAVIADRDAGREVRAIAFAFHAAIAGTLMSTAVEVARRRSIRHVVLSGGVFQNGLLRELLEDRKEDHRDVTLRFNESVPSNDGGIALGQAALACVAIRDDLGG